MRNKHYTLRATKQFERQQRKFLKKYRMTTSRIENIYDILESDPYNQSKKAKIKKLTDISDGDGVWRIRSKNIRIRYDIDKRYIILHSTKDRKNSYK